MGKKISSMQLLKASASDNSRLCEFYNSSALPGEVDLLLSRKNFFLPYEFRSEDHDTYLLVNEKDQIEAMASLVFLNGFLGGEKQTIGYATDLRVSNSRRAILSWTEHFMPLLEQEKKQRNCRFVFSVVAQMQKQAYNAFIRPRLTRKNLPRYHLFRNFRLVTVHGILPFAPSPLSSIFLRQGTSSDQELVADYLARQHRQSVLHFNSTAEEVIENIQRWPNFRMENFILAFDFHRNLVGCVAPWSVHHLQNITVTQYHGRTKVLFDSLKILALFRISKSLPHKNQALDFQYLTHFYADNPDIFYNLLHAAFTVSPSKFIAYSHYEGDISFTPPRTFVTANLKAGLYFIHNPKEHSPQFLNWSRNSPPPEFELPFL